MAIFQDGGRRHLGCRRHLGFLKSEFFLMAGQLKRVQLHRRTKFGRNWSNRGPDIAIFPFFKMADATNLDFSNLIFLTVRWLTRVELRHHTKFGPNRSNRA